MRRIACALIAWLAGVCPLVSRGGVFETGQRETEEAIRTWHKRNGLLAESVTAIIQTREGFLWVGTSEGIVRFDGSRFTELKLAPASTNRGLWVTALCEDVRGHLWIGTQQDGLFQLERGVVHRYTKANGLLADSVTSLAADAQGLVWIGTKSGLNAFTGTEFKSFTLHDGLPDELVSGVHVARSGTLWITTRAGMCQFADGRITSYPLQTESQGRSPEYLGAYEDRRGNLWAYGDTYLINLEGGKRFNYFRGNEATRIWSLCEGRDGRLWIGTGRGLFFFEDDRFQPMLLDEFREPDDIRAMYEDREGNLWLGTYGGGLVELRPRPVQVFKSAQGLPSSSPTALALDAGGRVLVGLARGGIFVGEAGRFERFGSPDSLNAQEFVSSLAISREGEVWAATLANGVYGFRNGRALQLTTANGLADDAVLSACVDGDGNVWAATRAGTLHRFQGQTTTRFDSTSGLTGSAVTVLLPAAARGIWLGTEDGTILRGDGSGRFTVAQSGDKLGRQPVLTLHEGARNRLWIGSAGGGLACLVNGSASASWNSSNGLPSEIVAGVLEDNARNLWLATGAGIYRVNSNNVQRALSDSQIPLACKLVSSAKTSFEDTPLFGSVRALASRDGKLWFATSEGVLNVDTRQPDIEPFPLPIYIESVAFNSQAALCGLRGVAWSSAPADNLPAVVGGKLRSLEATFTALSLSAPEKVRFRHKLEGSDSEWVEDGSNRFVKYERLPYGRYELRAAARIGDGDWQEAAMPFAFRVPTPLYFQPWAIFLYGVSAIALVAAVVRLVSHRRLRRALAKMEQQQSLERERMRIARDMHDEIGSKLTKLSFLSEHARMDAKSTGPLANKLESIAGTSRELLQTMDEIVWVVNPRNDSLENLAAYLSHYASEYFSNTPVECDLRLPRAIPEHPLSSEARHNLFLAFEEALNNVLKHSAASKVKIEMSMEPPEFEINITDNGRGFALPATDSPPQGVKEPQGSRNGNGLRNMRQRLSDIGGECSIRSQPGEGTTVSLLIHLNSNHHP